MAISRDEQTFLDRFTAAAADLVRSTVWPRTRASLESTDWILWSREGLAEFKAAADAAEQVEADRKPLADRGTVRAVMLEGVRVLRYTDGTPYTRVRTIEPTHR